MGKKSRSKREQRQARKMDSELLERFTSAREAEGLQCLVRNQTALPKLSVRVQSLVADVLPRLGSFDQKRTALTTAVLAWNRAILRQKAARSADATFDDTEAEMPPDTRGLILALEQAKSRMYPEDDRLVMDYEVRNVGGEVRFSVVSANTEIRPEQPAAQDQATAAEEPPSAP